VAGISGATGPSLEGISPVLTYYAGSTATGPPLSGPPTAVGTYTVVASFPGSADYSTASSPPVTFSILAPAATVTLSSSAGSTVFGESLTLTASVSLGGPGTGAPTGAVTFYDGAAALASVPLDPSGRAILTLSNLGLGVYSITAIYPGDARSSGGRSGTVVELVTPADTQVILVPHAIMKGKKIASLNLTAEVEPLAPGGGVPNGMVTFRVKKKTIGTAALSGGQAILTVKPGSVLNKSLTISYGGAAEFRSASLAAPKLTSRSLTTLPRPFISRRQARPAIGHASVSHAFSRFTAKTRHDPSGVIAHS
jgi:hypothetical protein